MGDEQIPVVRLCQRKKMDDQQIPQETEQHGCFDFMTTCKTHEHLDAPKHTLMDDLHAHSTSSSDEEGGERKKQKGLKEAIIGGKEETELKGTCVPIEKCGEEENAEKKSFLDKIKEKLVAGQQHKKAEEEEEAQCPAAAAGSQTKEKKGIIDKIKEKLHKNNENDVEK